MRQVISNIYMVYRGLFSYSPKMRWQIPVYVVLKVTVPLIESAIPAMAIALLSGGNAVRYVLGICGLILLMTLARSLGVVSENRVSIGWIGTRLEVFMRDLLEKSLKMDFCNVEPAKKQKKLSKGAQAISSNWVGVEGLTRNSFDLFCSMFGFLTYGTIVLSIHWSILLLILVITGVDLLLNRHAIHYADELSDTRSQAVRTNEMLTRQGISLSYGKDIRIYHVEHWFHSVFEEQIRTLKRCFSKQELRWYFPTLAEQAGDWFRNLILYSILVKMVLAGSITVAEFTFYIGVVSAFAIWTHGLVQKVSGTLSASVETGYYKDVMETRDVFRHGSGVKPDLTAPVSIEFRNVSFRYEEGDDYILSHLSFRIEAGQKIALVGNNGAGKTTIVKLICGFYMPLEGEVLINGISTREYDMDEYGKLISPVFQDGFISAFTVAANIAGGSLQKIDRERVRECLKKAGIWEKIDSLEKKEDTYFSQVLDQGGVEFSGGEIQKLLIARALYKEGRLLVLDEPTSALDPMAESQIYQKYNEMTREKTALFISHRLASTRFCDKILYLEHGAVAEQGTHEELLRKGGAYANMFEIQSHYYKEEVEEA